MTEFQLTGKRALITGSTQGIGLAIAKILAENGAEVFVHCSRDTEKAERVVKEIGAAHGIAADLGEKDAVKRLYAATGDLDIVIANASVQFRNGWDTITAEEFERQVNVNFRSTLFLMQTYIPAMQKKGWGRFVSVGSVQQYKPHTHMAVYAATKCAVMSLVHNISAQVAKDGVTVNNLSPGVIATPRNAQALADPVYCQVALAKIPAGFAGESTDCAGAALLLCSDAGRYITGTDLIVDGGMHL